MYKYRQVKNHVSVYVTNCILFITSGNFSPYIVSYMRNRTDEVSLRNVDGLWVTSIGAIGNFIGLTGGGILDKRFGPRVATASGGVIFRYKNFQSFHRVECSYIYWFN